MGIALCIFLIIITILCVAHGLYDTRSCRHPSDEWIKVDMVKEEPYDVDFVYRVNVYQCGLCKKHLIDEGLETILGAEAFLKSGLDPEIRAYLDKEAGK